jgi:hypothetical protein
MDPLLKKFEKQVGLPAPDCGRLLGYAKSSYYQVRNAGTLPAQTRRLIEIFMDLSDRDQRRLISKYVGDDEL